MRSTLLGLTFVLAFALFSPAVRAEDIDLDAPLPVDPSIAKMGQLENGLTYWIRPNQTPPQKVGLLLHIGSGSINEKEEQRGIAHFLEHMAFNGSENFGPGEVVKFFESLGMQYGSDQNAMTGFNQTTYFLYLPDNKKETIEKGLLYLTDVAFRLTLSAEEIDSERGVILGEMRARDGLGMRLMYKTLPLILPGSLVTQRIPIGLTEVIEGADRDVFLDYYRTWYRPEHSTFLVTGDVDVAEVEGLLSKALSPWKPSEKPPVRPDAGVKLSEELRAGIITDPEVTTSSVGILSLRKITPTKTVGDFRNGLVEQLGGIMMNRRFGRMIQEGGAAFQEAQVGTSSFLGLCEVVQAGAEGAPDQTMEMLTSLILEVRRACVHGFTEKEFETARRAMSAGLAQAAAREGTVDSMSWMLRLNGSLEQDEKPMSMIQTAEIAEKIMPTITLEDVHRAFVANSALDRGIILATLPEKEGVEIPTEEALLATFAKAVAAEVEKTGGQTDAKGFLAKEPEPGKIVSRSEVKDLNVTTVTFENGVTVHVKPTDFRKDTVFVNVRLVGGTIEETATNRGITFTASLGLTPGMAATKRHSASELTDLLTGRKFACRANAGEAELDLALQGSPTEMDDAFRLLHLLLTEGRVDATSLGRWKQAFLQQAAMLRKDVNALAGQAQNGLLTGDDARFNLPESELVETIAAEEAQAWLDRLLEKAPIEVAISGDIDADRAIELARRYLGSLSKRPEKSEAVEALRKVTVNKGPMERIISVETITPQAMVRVGWRGAARGARTDARALMFASQVATARLLQVIREEKGLTYSIQAAAVPSSAYDGNGCFFAIFSIAPDKAEEAAEMTKQVIEGLLTEPPTDAEMQAVSAQLKNKIESTMREPQFWVTVLSGIRTNGRSIQDISKLVENYTGITKEAIAEVLTRHLTEERFFKVIARPAPAK